MLLPRIPSPALAPYLLSTLDRPGGCVTVCAGRATLWHADGSELSASEQRRVRGWFAADDAEPFEAAS
jgi:hypothetical protein